MKSFFKKLINFIRHGHFKHGGSVISELPRYKLDKQLTEISARYVLKEYTLPKVERLINHFSKRSFIMEKKKRILELVSEIVDIVLDKEVEETPAKEEKAGTTTAKVFTVSKPPQGKKEVDLYKKQWGKLNQKQQEAYIAGEIDSLGKSIGGGEEKPKTDTKKKLEKEDVAKALATFIEDNGRDAAIEKLGEFKAKSLGELKKKDYAKFIESLGSKEEPEADLFS